MSGDLPERLEIFEGDAPYNRGMNEIAGEYNGLTGGDPRRERLFLDWKRLDAAQYEELFD